MPRGAAVGCGATSTWPPAASEYFDITVYVFHCGHHVPSEVNVRKETSEWSIRMLIDLQSRINVDAEYQRGKVWSRAQQALLIDSLLRNFDIPKIFLRKRSDGSKFLFDVIDGKQRLTAIWLFASNDVRLLRNSEEFSGLGDLGGKCWSELPAEAQDQLQFSNITITKIEQASEDDIHELFLRLQRGEPLNAAEKRNAMTGPIRDFVANTLAKHSLWNTTGIRSARFGFHEHAAILLALCKQRGPTNLKGADLQKLYDTDDFSEEGELAARTQTLLDQLKEISDCAPKEIRTRWGLVDLALSVIQLNNKGIVVDPSEIMNFYMDFEKNRTAVGKALDGLQTQLVNLSVSDGTEQEKIEEEVKLEVPEIASSMLTYYLAFTREGATEENVRTRSQIMHDSLVEHLGIEKA